MVRLLQAKRKIKVAVSSCLLGKSVRYDGQHKRHALIVNMLNDYFECIEVCPEMLAGLGVPRPPVQLMQLDDSICALGVDDRKIDVTNMLKKVALEFVERHIDLGGMILQSRSPSCGFGSTPLFNSKDEIIGTTNGLFADQLTKTFPDLPIREDTWFENQDAIEAFITQVENYIALASA